MRVRPPTYCESIRAIAFLCRVAYESLQQTTAKLRQVAATDAGSRQEPSGPAPSKTTAAVARPETREDRQTARAFLFARPIVAVTEAVSASPRTMVILRRLWARKSLATRSPPSPRYGVPGEDRVPSCEFGRSPNSTKILLLLKLQDSA